MTVDRAEPVSREPLFLDEIEHGGRAVVRRDVVGGAAKRRAPAPYATRSVTDLLERVERGEPAGQHGSHPTVGWDAKKAVAFAELAVLVSATGHEHVLETGTMEMNGTTLRW